MRDPSRIDTVLDAVRAAWVAEPDLRLGQLLYAAVASADKNTPPCPRLFYIEDDELAAAVTTTEWRPQTSDAG
jgi:hypothetical protein